MEGIDKELQYIWNKRRFDIQMLFLIVATFCFFNTSVGAPTPGHDYWWHNACDSNISTLHKKRHSRNAKGTALEGVKHHYTNEVKPYVRQMNGINNTDQIKMKWLPKRLQEQPIKLYHKQLCIYAATIQALRNIKVNTEDENLIISRTKVLDSTKDNLQNLICEVQHDMHKQGIKNWKKFTPAKLKVKINNTMDGSAVYQEDYGVLTLYGQYLEHKPRRNNTNLNKPRKNKNQGKQVNSMKNPKKNRLNQQNRQNKKRGNKRKQKLQENGKQKKVKKVIA